MNCSALYMHRIFQESIYPVDYEVIVRKKTDNTSEDSSLLGSEKELSRLIPHTINPFHIYNFPILISYFNTGVAIMISSAPMTYYMIDTLDVSSGLFTASMTLIFLPWSLKFLFGMITDSFYLFGYRRKSWMMFGWTVYTAINLLLASFAKPGYALLSCMGFLYTCAYVLSDVCNDAQSIERTGFESVELKGSFQTGCYAMRCIGLLIGSIQAALLYNTPSWGWGLTISQIFLLAALIPLCSVLPTAFNIIEIKQLEAIPTLSSTWQKAWEILQLKAVWSPMIFIILYQSLVVPNSAMLNYWIYGLQLNDYDIGVQSIVGSLAAMLSYVFYQRVIFHRSFRETVLVFGTLNSLTYLGQIVLYYHAFESLGMSKLVYLSINTAAQYFVNGLVGAPIVIIVVMVCPKNNEGMIYAVLTTLWNLTTTLAADLGTILTYLFDITNTALADGHVAGMTSLTIFVCILQLIPLFAFIGYLPDSREEHQALIDKKESSYYGGLALLLFAVATIIATITLDLAIIFA